MRLFFRYAVPRQKVNDGLRLDLEFARQLVDSDLICVSHASFYLRLCLFRLLRIILAVSGRGLGDVLFRHR